MVTKPTNKQAHKIILYYKPSISPTCFVHFCDHLQGRVLQWMGISRC